MLALAFTATCGVIKLVFDKPKKYYSWDEYNDDIYKLSENLNFEPSVIIGIARGGLVPAVQLSHILGRPLVVATWQTRDGGVKEKIKIPDYALIVDDINDSGLTLTQFTKGVKTKFQTLTMFSKDSSQYTVDYYAKKAEDDQWIVFPWE